MGVVCCRPEKIDFGGEVELNHFELLPVIGEGAFGKVRIVRHRATRRKYALKYISKKHCSELRATNNVIKERLLLERIDHPFVVNLHYAFHDDENMFMVLDLMLGGDLRFYSDKPMSEPQVRFYAAELTVALIGLHADGIAHRDIKPENVLLDDKGHAHLTDFNVATQFDEKTPVRSSKAGSPGYMAPEMYAKTGYTTIVDWWSLGIMSYELLFGVRPFLASTVAELEVMIQNNPVEFPPDACDRVSPECLDFIKKLLNKSPSHRLGSGVDGAAHIKDHAWFRGINWSILERKEMAPPFVPGKSFNFDMTHHLEELLLSDELLRPHARRPMNDSSPFTNKSTHDGMQERLDMDRKLAVFYYTRPTTEFNAFSIEPDTTDPSNVENCKPQNMSDSSTNHHEQAKLQTKGYHTTSSDEIASTISAVVVQ